jgi:hypothetical protein
VAVVPVPLTVGSGLSSSSDFNEGVRDPLLFLMKRPMARLRQIVAQSIPNGTPTALTFTASDVDQDWVTATNAGHSNSVNTTRWTANYAGWYECSGGVSFAANVTGARGCYWSVNGTLALGVEGIGAPTPGGATHGQPARVETLYLNVGDYLELLALQISGGALLTAVGGTATGSTMNVRLVSN